MAKQKVTELGKVAPVYKGTWNRSTGYKVFDITYVPALSSSYIAVKDNKGSEPSPDNAKWSLLVKGVETDPAEIKRIATGAVTKALEGLDLASLDVETAKKLFKPVDINGVKFDGSKSITVTATPNNDDNLVHKTGTEDVAGVKRYNDRAYFYNNIVVSNHKGAGKSSGVSAPITFEVPKPIDDGGYQLRMSPFIIHSDVIGQTNSNAWMAVQSGGMLVLSGGESGANLGDAMVAGTKPALVDANGYAEDVVIAADSRIVFGSGYQKGGGTGNWGEMKDSGEVVLPSTITASKFIGTATNTEGQIATTLTGGEDLFKLEAGKVYTATAAVANTQVNSPTTKAYWLNIVKPGSDATGLELHDAYGNHFSAVYLKDGTVRIPWHEVSDSVAAVNSIEDGEDVFLMPGKDKKGWFFVGNAGARTLVNSPFTSGFYLNIIVTERDSASIHVHMSATTYNTGETKEAKIRISATTGAVAQISRNWYSVGSDVVDDFKTKFERWRQPLTGDVNLTGVFNGATAKYFATGDYVTVAFGGYSLLNTHIGSGDKIIGTLPPEVPRPPKDMARGVIVNVTRPAPSGSIRIYDDGRINLNTAAEYTTGGGNEYWEWSVTYPVAPTPL